MKSNEPIDYNATKHPFLIEFFRRGSQWYCHLGFSWRPWDCNHRESIINHKSIIENDLLIIFSTLGSRKVQQQVIGIIYPTDYGIQILLQSDQHKCFEISLTGWNYHWIREIKAFDRLTASCNSMQPINIPIYFSSFASINNTLKQIQKIINAQTFDYNETNTQTTRRHSLYSYCHVVLQTSVSTIASPSSLSSSTWS